MEGPLPEIFVEVLLDQNLAKPLDYKVPEGLNVELGMRVEVPLQSKFKKGTISKIKDRTEWPGVKEIAKILSPKGELSDPQWKLAHWMSHYYCAPLQKVLRCFIPVNVRKGVSEKKQLFLTLAKTHDECIKAIELFRGKAAQKAAVLEEILHAPKGLFLADLEGSKKAAASLAKEGWITAQKVDVKKELLEEEFFPTLPKLLNAEQKRSLDAICQTIETKEFATHLIYGVTGSGKTEVYMQAIQRALEMNRSAIMLVPEISLTSQTIERFKARFSQKIAILHHRRSLGERTTAWEDLRGGKAKLVIGARSALFCPAQNLGLIIVDEEHDSSYKQSDETPCYHGRDTAVMRGFIERCSVILGSATPSIESRYNASIGKYQFHELLSRATSAPMPKVTIVDMALSVEKQSGFTHFSDPLLEGIKKRLDKGEQTLLFLNRRGYHRMQVCKQCLHIIKCPHCDLALTFHKKDFALKCHFCHFQREILRECPSCGQRENLHFKGFGTEHVERSLHAIFPEVRTLRMDRDTTHKKNSHEEMFKQFRAHKADVLIGTQMIAKGFHFPSVTLVGVLNPDAALFIPDFRSPEQVFQLITQVAGRAGRAELEGEVIIQTFLPEHPTIKWAAAQDYETFYKAQIEERRTFGYPPFSHLVKLLFTDANEEKAKEKAGAAYQMLKKRGAPHIEIWPPMPSGYAKVKDLFRFQIVLKGAKIHQILPYLKDLPAAKIDVDPISIF